MQLNLQLQVYYSTKGKKLSINYLNSSKEVSSVAQSCPTLCDPMNRSTPGLPVHHQPPEFHEVAEVLEFQLQHQSFQ